MKPLRLAAIVEGHGEVDAVPILVNRIAADINPSLNVRVNPVLRVSASRLMQPKELERHIELAARKLGGQGAILVLVDCDWDGGCPAQAGPELLARAQEARSDMIISVVLAKKEYEAWFIAAANSLRGERGLAADLVSPASPEDIRGAKEWLSRHMPHGQPYSETIHQPALTAIFDLGQARWADSFDKCYREVVRLLKALKAGE